MSDTRPSCSQILLVSALRSQLLHAARALDTLAAPQAFDTRANVGRIAQSLSREESRQLADNVRRASRDSLDALDALLDLADARLGAD